MDRYERIYPITMTSANATSTEYIVSIFYQRILLKKRRFARLRAILNAILAVKP